MKSAALLDVGAADRLATYRGLDLRDGSLVFIAHELEESRTSVTRDVESVSPMGDYWVVVVRGRQHKCRHPSTACSRWWADTDVLSRYTWDTMILPNGSGVGS